VVFRQSLLRRIVVVGVITVGLVLCCRLCWLAYDSIPRGRAQTAAEFRQVMQEMHAIDRANLERDWIASGKPLPPGGFEALWKPVGAASESQASDASPPGDHSEKAD